MSNNPRQTAGKVITFLEQNRLSASPTNYTVGYMYVTRTNPGLVVELDRLLDDGMRLTQTALDEIAATFGLSSGGGGASAAPQEDDPTVALRHMLLRIADISSDQNQAAGVFSDNLTEISDHISENPELRQIVAKMIDITHQSQLALKQSNAEIENLRQDLEAAKNDAKIDALTGLANRRAIDEHLSYYEKNNEPVVIAFCDVDRFKSINDTHGHAVGDRVLKSLAEEIRNVIQDEGLIGRWGGEEFVAVFKGDDLENAQSLVDQARVRMSHKSLKVRETDQPLGAVTFSAGVASGRGNIAAITARADELLYEAKRAGRNRVLSATCAEKLAA